MRAGLIFLSTCLVPLVAADPSWRALARYIDLPYAAQAQTMAADSAGNLFIVSNVTEPSGRPQIRVTKTDPSGATLASMDFGGSVSLLDIIAGVAVDPQGDVVIVGTTSSPDFPLVSPLISKTAPESAFIVKIDSQLRNILFSTRLGGTTGGPPLFGGTVAGALAVDQGGNIYVTGETFDTDFPVTPGTFQTKPPLSDGSDSASYSYLTEIAADGHKVVFSTFFGDSHVNCSVGSNCNGLSRTRGSAIALDSRGNVIIAGSTNTDKLPVTAGVFGPSCGSCTYEVSTSFLAKFAPGGSKLLWATYIPVEGLPHQTELTIQTIAVDAGGDVIAGGFALLGFPVTTGALQTSVPGPGMVVGFVAKFDPEATNLLFATYFGGGLDSGTYHAVTALTVDSQGTIWLTGFSVPEELPAPKNTPLLGTTYVAGLSPDGSTLSNIFTAPAGAAGQAIILSEAGTAIALGSAGSLLTVSQAAGPSLVGIANSAAAEVSNAVVPEELISLYGIGLGPSTPVSAELDFGVAPTSLGGVQVLFDGVRAPLLYVGPTQINCVVPDEVTFHDVTQIEIVTPSGARQGPTMLIRPSQPQVFRSFKSDQGEFPAPAVALNQDGSLNSSTNPAAPGSVVSVWATGGGVLQGGQPIPVSVLWGPGSLEVLYAGNAPGLVYGVMQINFRLPLQPNLNPGPSFQVQIGDAVSDPFLIYITGAEPQPQQRSQYQQSHKNARDTARNHDFPETARARQ